MQLQKVKIGKILLIDVIANPDKFPDEVIAASLDKVKSINSQLYEAKKILEGHLINNMEEDSATKLIFKNVKGEEMIATLKSGPMKSIDGPDIYYKEKGFNPLEIGEYVFKPSWTKAKEARKFGAAKQDAIDVIFHQGEPSIELKKK